jgi:hypothetical protein
MMWPFKKSPVKTVTIEPIADEIPCFKINGVATIGVDNANPVDLKNVVFEAIGDVKGMIRMLREDGAEVTEVKPDEESV